MATGEREGFKMNFPIQYSPGIDFVKSWQGIVEISLRAVTLVRFTLFAS